MEQDVITAISATIAGCSMVVALVGLIAGQWRNSKKDGSELSSVLTEVRIDLKYIRDSVDELKNNQARLEERVGATENRISHLEEQVLVPVRRLDRLEDRLGINGQGAKQ